MHWLLTAHVRRYQRHYHATGHVWQGRFKAFPIQDDDHLLVVLRYVERNPLHAGLVGRAEAWGVVQPPRPRPGTTGPLAGSRTSPPRPAVGGGGKCPDLRDRVGPHPPQPPARCTFRFRSLNPADGYRPGFGIQPQTSWAFEDDGRPRRGNLTASFLPDLCISRLQVTISPFRPKEHDPSRRTTKPSDRAGLQEPNAARKQERPARSASAFWSASGVALSLDLCRARGRRTPEEPLGAEILIDVRPVNAVAAARDAPVLPLGRGGVEQARIPGQRDRDGPPVPQGDAEGILGELHVGDTLVSRQRQDAHAKPPKMPLHVRRPVFESAATPWARTRSSARARPAATRTWPRDRPDRHGHAAAHAARGSRSKSGKDRSARQSA